MSRVEIFLKKQRKDQQGNVIFETSLMTRELVSKAGVHIGFRFAYAGNLWEVCEVQECDSDTMLVSAEMIGNSDPKLTVSLSRAIRRTL